MSVPDAAASIGISTRKAWSMAQSGELPTVRLGGRVVVPLADLRALLAPRTPQRGGR